MKPGKYQGILYFIITAIVLTLSLQAYWFYRSFKAEQRELVANVQVSLNKAVDDYYTHLAQEQSMLFASDTLTLTYDSNTINLGDQWAFLDSMPKGTIQRYEFSDSTNHSTMTAISIVDSIVKNRPPERFRDTMRSFFQRLGRKPFEQLTNKIVISFAEEEMSLPVLDSIFHEELHERELWIDYSLKYDTPWGATQSLGTLSSDPSVKSLQAKSSFLMQDSSLEVYFKNTTPLILHRNGISLGLSLIFVGCIIGCLLYLLRIIREQKQLAEIKNDLISNITHEFKTPLATIGVALEGIQKFNADNDPQKSKKYAAMSQEQVKKLSGMVEKLLETATLDSNALVLNKEEIDLVALCQRLAVLPEAYVASQKSISLNAAPQDLKIHADAFHLENVINTLIDNALKYGGDIISLNITTDASGVNIAVHDNGSSLNKAQSQRIFEKFYRVPKGDTHDVKGFGIGLYYAKNIIEKHGGSIGVNLKNGTTFTLTLPHE
ncbi:sensor histidine kinase [Gilvibacter sediminis]|uniref:sensor histidine kinase n=1 Tax=Gilvibacter sediminis TaxID=379071 RepID=UPI00235091F9|nr:HAMP domain-containing sensor histidine kinase [Gilvibacter sediminis]MDC7998707.1 HAMP domain-containing sensor histidine kinase [Gilvibacter sediminis]